MVRTIVFFIGFLCLSLSLKAQKTPDLLLKEVIRYNTLIKEEKLPESHYLKHVDSLLGSFFSNYNGFLPHDSLLNLLKHYREITVGGGELYAPHKVYYYYYLAINADVRGKGGQAIYYAEKVLEEKAKKGEKSIFKIGLATNYYSRNRNYLKVIELYKKEKPFLLEFENMLLSQRLSPVESLNFIGLQRINFEAYLILDDTSSAENVITLTEKMHNSLINRKDVSLNIKLHSVLSLNLMKIKMLYTEGKPTDAFRLLQQTENTINHNKEALKDQYLYLNEIINDLKMDYLISFSSPGHALKLLDSTRTKGLVTHYNNLHTATLRADLLFKNEDYKSAYNALKESLTFQEQEYVTITNEMDELLYAHSEAEQNRLELLDSEKEKRKRNLIYSLAIALVSTFSITLAIYYYKEKKRFKRTIDDLNNTTEIQIEEAKNRASLEEKIKLGQDLHDDMSGTLAGMLRLIETTKDCTKEKNTANNLDLLYFQTKNIYSSVRTRSHQMYNEVENDYFEESIKKVINTALLHYGYKTEIDVDKALTAKLDAPQRIELLRIIQESVTNILKHAKKATEAFIFMFKQGDSILLQIGDNGVSQKKLSTEGIGLKSIAARVKALHGELSIDNTKGMILNISFPAPQ